MSSREVLEPLQFLPFQIPKLGINLPITSTTNMSTNPPKQKAPKEAPTPVQTPTRSSYRTVSPTKSHTPPSSLPTEDPALIAIQIYQSANISKLQNLRQELERVSHGEGGQMYRAAIAESLGDWGSLAYAADVFRAAKLRCDKCGLIHEEEVKASLGDELFKAQYAALKKANARTVEVGNSKMAEIGEWVEVLEEFVKKLKDCPVGTS
jgi:hypothetical protein